MIKEIIFYSNVHLGDLHLARPFVKWFVDNFNGVSIKFDHNYSPEVFSDINGLKFSDAKLWEKLPRHGDIFINDEEGIYVFNTWAYSGNIRTGCNYLSLYTLFHKYYTLLIQKDERFQHLQFPKEISEFAPKIDFNYPEIRSKEINDWFSKNPNKTNIYISNNYVESNQANNFHMNDFIVNLSTKYNAANWYISNKINPIINLSNVFYCEDIINKKGFDLLDQSYLSTFCDIIIGRNSGPFTFAEVFENLNKKWITMSNLSTPQDAFNLFYLLSSKGIFHHEEDPSKITKILETYI